MSITLTLTWRSILIQRRSVGLALSPDPPLHARDEIWKLLLSDLFAFHYGIRWANFSTAIMARIEHTVAADRRFSRSIFIRTALGATSMLAANDGRATKWGLNASIKVCIALLPTRPYQPLVLPIDMCAFQQHPACRSIVKKSIGSR